jgi:hypothetical protein
VDAADLDGDGLLDLIFACFKDSDTETDSMVFLQEANGFCGTAPSFKLPTVGARGVAVGDIDGDSLPDIVFANGRSAGIAEIESYIYWGKAGGGFEASPTGLMTSGAQDVELADVDNDGDIDVVFANMLDNTGKYDVSSSIYLNDGSGGFAASPEWSLPTTGAIAVAVADIDGRGWMDLVFACQRDGSTYNVSSMVYLGGTSGWGSGPDIEIPTEGATDVAVSHLIEYGTGGYISRVITPEDPPRTGTFHTFRYTASLGSSQTGTFQLVDTDTWEVLAETAIASGPQEWVVADMFRVKEHTSILVRASVQGLDTGGSFELDDLWLNWTERVERAPEVLSMDVEISTLYRTEGTTIWINVTDEYDLISELSVVVEHRLNGSNDNWATYMVGMVSYQDPEEAWTVSLRPLTSAPLGVYDLRVLVRDLDIMESPWVEFPEMIEVLNNVPTAPEVRIMPARAMTTSTLKVEIVTAARDVETPGLTYRFQWYRNGEMIESATGDTLSTFHTSKGQNWSVEVHAYDGDDEGPSGWAWKLIDNAPPVVKDDLPDPEFDEDTTDTNWLDLSNAFEDPDGDPLTWSLMVSSENLEVVINTDSGHVTLVPAHDWNGEENLTFMATDGEFNVTQTVTVNVVPVNDIPSIATVDGEPVVGDTITYTIKQGDLLEIHFTVADVEGDEVIAIVNSSLVILDEDAHLISFQADNDAVGTLRFGLRIYDVVSIDEKVSLNFVIIIENKNDEMGDPQITSPGLGESFKVNQSISFEGICDDPDIQYGQMLNYTWESNISGILGFGSSLTVRILEPGLHRITLTVSDPDFSKTVSVDVDIKPLEDVTPPPPPPDDDDEPSSINWVLWIGLIAVLVIVGATLYVLTTRRKTSETAAIYEQEYELEHMEPAPETMKATVDHVEEGTSEAGIDAEVQAPTEPPEEAEIEIEGSVSLPSTTLSIEAKKTQAADEATMALFTDEEAAEPVMTDEEREELRIENLKRTYQNAIGRLPYGIPSKELADRDWVDLAAALATGEKKTLPDGQETTEILGRWYYSDAMDTGTFLKEHGAKAKQEKAKKREDTPESNKEELLAKLEERFIIGDISEKAYEELKRKYSD